MMRPLTRVVESLQLLEDDDYSEHIAVILGSAQERRRLRELLGIVEPYES